MVANKAHTRRQKNLLIEIHGNCCQLCETRNSKKFLGVHHIVHDSCGGSWELENLLWVCWSCHTKVHRLHKIPSGVNPLNTDFVFEKVSKRRKKAYNNRHNSNRRFKTYRAA